MEKVYYSNELQNSFKGKLSEELKEAFNGCKRIAIKIHFGEPGNKNTLVPSDIVPILDVIKRIGIGYFFYDSSTAYRGPRGQSKTHLEVARNKGWDKIGEISTEDIFVKSKGKYMEYEVSKPLADADGVLVISHLKGHACSGFGGAIKNLGMGALSKASKGAIHDGGKPVFTGECIACHACERSCPIDGIIIEKTGKDRKKEDNADRKDIAKKAWKNEPIFKVCYGCSNCTTVCPLHSLKVKVAGFGALLADGANAAQNKFKKYYYINLLKRIAARCDCVAETTKIIAKDAGIVFSKDAVAIDTASHDIIVKNEGKEVFFESNKKTGLMHCEEAEKLDMGKMEYVIVHID